MYDIKNFRKVNAVLGVLKGDFTQIEIEKYSNELLKVVKENLSDGFSYIFDITDFYTGGFDGSDSVDKKIGELRLELEELGMKKNYILGAGMKTFIVIRREAENMGLKSETLFCESLDEVIQKLTK